MPLIRALVDMINTFLHYLQAFVAIAFCVGFGLVSYIYYQIRKSD